MLQDSATAFLLSGEQTVRTVAETHRSLAEHYASASRLTLDLSAITDADLTFVQLIESVRRAAARDGKHVCISGSLPVPVRDILVRGGFLNSPEQTLFWTAP